MLTTTPLISVIMPAYNAAMHIGEAIESILTQTHSNLELIIIDDCSTDNTLTVISAITDSRIVLLKKESNSGYTTSLNMGIKISKGDYIARMDADDISHPTRFEKQIAAFEKYPSLVLCGTWFQEFGDRNTLVTHPTTYEQLKIALLDYCAIGHPTVMLRHKFLQENNLFYNTAFEPAEDYNFWVLIASKGQIINLPEVLLFYRVHKTQVSAKRAAEQKTKTDIARAYMLSNIYTIKEDRELIEKVAINQKFTDYNEFISYKGLLSKAILNNNNFFELEAFKSWLPKKERSIIYLFLLRTKLSLHHIFYHLFFNNLIAPQLSFKQRLFFIRQQLNMYTNKSSV